MQIIQRKKIARWMKNGKSRYADGERANVLKLLEALPVISTDPPLYPPLEEFLVIPKGEKLDGVITYRDHRANCRVSSCNERAMKRFNHFCHRCYSTFHPDREANMKKVQYITLHTPRMLLFPKD